MKDGRELLSNCVASSAAEQNLYGGVVPEIASRRHIEPVSYTHLDVYKRQEYRKAQNSCQKHTGEFLVPAAPTDNAVENQQAQSLSLIHIWIQTDTFDLGPTL